ncbi:hypothetical protein [Synechococcus sp. M16CYN]|uniref:hypothetical protein n=1 Tax=Synechococcus sp. M16CYN TaxID=3103139 RepID=UPI0032537C0F
MTPADWTSQEEQVARHVFNIGKQRSIKLLISTLQSKCSTLDTDESVWTLHDFLSTERHIFEGRSEFDYNNILFTLADLLKRQLITLEEIKGLNPKKLAKIKAMSMF